METFLECEAMYREPPPGYVFVGSFAEIDPRKVAEVVRRSRDKKTMHLRPIFALSPKPIARFCWKHARLSLFRPQPHLPSFTQIHPSFRDLWAKTTFQIVTIIGDPIGIGSPVTCGPHGDTRLYANSHWKFEIAGSWNQQGSNRLLMPLKTSADASPSLERNHLKLSIFSSGSQLQYSAVMRSPSWAIEHVWWLEAIPTILTVLNISALIVQTQADAKK